MPSQLFAKFVFVMPSVQHTGIKKIWARIIAGYCPVGQSNKCQYHCGSKHTRFYVKLLTTSNTASTNTTAADDEVDYVVRIRKDVSGFDFPQSRYTRTYLVTVVTKPLFKECFGLWSLDKSAGADS